MQSVPTNLITGFLGVGKTTAVIDLLQRKEPGSRWAVLVNEYGAVSIDGALIEGAGPDGVTVKEVGGGCVCCASAPFLPVAIHFLLLEARPARLIIETTGLGHPARLLDSLRMSYHGRLDVRATLGLVDPADFAKPEMKENPIFIDQIQMADVLVMNKMDTATPELVSEFQTWANNLFPPKLLIAGTTHGRLDPAWLDLSANDERLPLFPQEPTPLPKGRGKERHPTPNPSLQGGEPSWPSPLAGEGGEPEDRVGGEPSARKEFRGSPEARAPSPGGEAPPPSPARGEGQDNSSFSLGRAGGVGSSAKRYPTSAGARSACGWVFDAADVFDEGRLLALLAGTKEVSRLKGVFHVADEWIAVNRAGAAVSVSPTAYRRDNRLEVFAEGLDWDAFERALVRCILVPSGGSDQ